MTTTTDEIKIERTGNIFSIASSEYLVTFPNGDKTRIWSPPWHEKTPEDEDAGALEYAKELWRDGNYIPWNE